MKSITVAAAIIEKEDRIFATQRGYGTWKGYWEFPGGKLEPGETPREALTREIQEELDASVQDLRHFHTLEYDYPDFHLKLHCYLCRLATDTLTLLEHSAARWLTKDQLDEVNWLPADNAVIEALKKYL